MWGEAWGIVLGCGGGVVRSVEGVGENGEV